jgi:hypothetical protein
LVDDVGSKVLPCLFLGHEVLCSFRKDEKGAVMDRCLKCSHYLRFMAEMEEEDERVMNEIDEERKELGLP